MNKQESDILNVILQYHCRNQRALAERCGFSLGMVNRSVKGKCKIIRRIVLPQKISHNNQ